MIGDIPINSETLFITDFVNLKIKSVKSFEYTHGVGCVCICS
jgi:hypothetical protein